MSSRRRGLAPRIVPLVALLLLSTDGNLCGQEPEWIRLGTLVRVNTDGESPRQVIGVLAGHSADTIFIIPERSNDPSAFAVVDIVKLEMNLERSTRSRAGARVGFVVALAGAVAYGLAQDDAVSMIGGAALFSGAFVPVGAIIGHRIKTETWAEIPLKEGEVTDVPGAPASITIRVSLRL